MIILQEDKQLTPKQQFNKIISKLRKYAKDNGHYMSVEKFGTADNNGNTILYFTTNRYDPRNSVRFVLDLGYESSMRNDFNPEYIVGWSSDSDSPEFKSEIFNSNEKAYDFILNYIQEYGNI